ncbi:MAG: CoA-binding protein [Cyclobacteriaceae bacterium]|jgi:predicted CoA-binding protein|nr:CoA-binding protein [Flammeovirgaceae bacterium]
MNKKTVVVGATPNASRYAYLASEMLISYQHTIVPIGIKTGEVMGQPILNMNDQPVIQDVDTITMYIGPQHQPPYYNYLLSLQPKRIIFNPGTENAEFEKLAEESGVEAIEACTLVMLRSNQY